MFFLKEFYDLIFYGKYSPKVEYNEKLPILKLNLINENPLIFYIFNRNREFLLPTLYNILNIKYCQTEIPGSVLK